MAEGLEQALSDIREAAGGPGSTMYLAALGNQLIAAGVDFRAETGKRNLSDVLRKLTDFCRIEGAVVRFLAGAPHVAAIPSVVPAPGAGPAQRLSGELWRAMVFDKPDLAFFYDLENDSVIEVPVAAGQPGEPVASDPVRFIRVPTLPSEQQVAIAQTCLRGKVSQEDLDAIFGGGPGWMRRVHDLLPPGLSSLVDDARQVAVVNAAKSWLALHDLPAQKFIHSDRRPKTPASGPRNLPMEGDLEAQLRRRLHEILDTMTLAELLELRIPARYSLP